MIVFNIGFSQPFALSPEHVEGSKGCVVRQAHHERPRSIALTLALVLMILPSFAFAHGGEDHGDEAKTVVSLPASGPRLELKSPDVELLGVIQDGKLTLYADHYTSNEPIRNAKIELESNGRKVQAQAEKDGSYTVAADWLKQPGKHEVVVSVEANGLEDLLIGSMEVPGTKSEAHRRTWLDTAKWTAGGGAAAILLAVLFKLLRRRKGVTVVALPLFAAFMLGGHGNPSFAHGDEDHGEKSKAAPAATAVSNVPTTAQASPVRLPDGSIFAPKPVQRLLGIRTVLGEQRDIAKTVELNGHISADPNFSGRVQSSQSGRIAAPAGGFPTLGMKVGKGPVVSG